MAAKPMSVIEFGQLFPDDDACLAYLFNARYGDDFPCPRCGVTGKFRKLSKVPAYTCQCGEHIHPMVGTPFYRSHTPLQKWFYAMYLFTTTRHGVPAKELQRQLAVNYKTAWRMGHEIRKYLGLVDGDPSLGGNGSHVEIDETMIGGKRPGKRGRGAAGKTTVFGMLERGGSIMTRVVENVRRATLEPHILANVKKGSTVSTDELKSYATLARHGYEHGAVNHSAEEWVRGKHHVQGLEGFWSLIKRSIKGTHVHVSRRHLAKYLAEFEFRWNLRRNPAGMFPLLLKRLGT
jgi:transposase-like protein